MSLHNHDIRNRLTRFLQRRQIPRRIEDKPEAQNDEIRALCLAIERHAPRDHERLALWWPLFETALGEAGSATFWPTEREIRDAAGPASRRLHEAHPAPAPQRFDAHANTARLIREGKPVGENWLYGRFAVELQLRGLVSREEVTRYRDAVYASRVAVWGEAKASAWRAEMEAQHRAAWRVAKGDQTRSSRDITVPNTRPNQTEA
ncbi:hypothetical protein [Frigidibacter oleivorans]|uniref:hypothetical protein n=1 Tax=Frigidibacter oleivorans TaxID=2487129 RepID=UPI000F8D05AD|nr:hypothetical protein [Frigidibacter oleivorans]